MSRIFQNIPIENTETISGNELVAENIKCLVWVLLECFTYFIPVKVQVKSGEWYAIFRAPQGSPYGRVI